MNTFFLEILSPKCTFYEGECLSLQMPISDGMIGIMANHTPLSAAISDGEINFKKPNGENVTCVVSTGIADITDNHVTILCESTLYPNEIDEESERRKVLEAQIEIKKHQSRKDYLMWQLSLNKAANRLKIKTKQSNINL